MLRTWLAVLAVLVGLSVAFAADTNSALDKEPKWQQARKELAQGNAGAARNIFEELLKQYPDDANLQLFLGVSLLRLRDPQGALLAIKRAIAIAPNHVEARTLLGYVELEVRGDVDAAIREYAKVVELKPQLAEAYHNLAVAQKKKGELDQAIATLNRALERKADYGAALTTRGAIYAQQAKWSEARRDFERALELSPRDDGALYGLAQVLGESKDYAGAQRALSELISRSANFVYWLEWGRIVLIRFWWVLLGVTLALVARARFRKARTQAHG